MIQKHDQLPPPPPPPPIKKNETKYKAQKTNVLQYGKQFLLHKWQPSCYALLKPDDKSWMRKEWWLLLRQTQHIRGHLWDKDFP